MPTEVERIEEQLRRSFEGEAWHGPSVTEALAGVSAADAHQHPIRGAHSIWEIVLHLVGTYHLVLRRLKGDGRPLSADEDWPPMPEPSEEKWAASQQALRDVNADLQRAVRRFSPDALDNPLIREPSYPAYLQFIGVTQHDLYHAGQIVLLKRALTAAAQPPRNE